MIDFDILHFKELDSTNAYAMRHLDTLCDRQIILADRQTRGYGRFKRPWLSDSPGNLFLSIVLKPDPELERCGHIANLTQYMSLVLCKTLEHYHVSAAIKWPNDVLVDGKKIAGILSETSIRGNRLKGLALGVGINLNLSGEKIRAIDQPATALNRVTGKHQDPFTFLRRLLELFFRGYEALPEKGFGLIRSEYEKRCRFLGRKIRVHLQHCRIIGIAHGFTSDGNLMLRTEQADEIITAGDVQLLRD